MRARELMTTAASAPPKASLTLRVNFELRSRGSAGKIRRASVAVSRLTHIPAQMAHSRRADRDRYDSVTSDYRAGARRNGCSRQLLAPVIHCTKPVTTRRSGAASLGDAARGLFIRSSRPLLVGVIQEIVRRDRDVGREPFGKRI